MCVTEVQWSRSCFARADKPGSTPCDAVFCFLVVPLFFLLFGLCFLALFFLLACFPLFLLLTLLFMHLDQYIF